MQVKINTSHFFEAAMDNEWYTRREQFRKLGSNVTVYEKLDSALHMDASFRPSKNSISKSYVFKKDSY